MWQIEFNVESFSEVEKALAFYEEKGKSIASDFLFEIKHSVSSLESNPFFQIRYKNIRCLPLKKFPYMIHFEIDEVHRLVKIVGCVHTSLDPNKYWR